MFQGLIRGGVESENTKGSRRFDRDYTSSRVEVKRGGYQVFERNEENEKRHFKQMRVS